MPQTNRPGRTRVYEPTALVPVEQVWLTMLDAPPSAGATMDAAQVYVAIQSGQLVALDRETGSTVWMRSLAVTFPPIVRGGLLFVAGAGEVWALDALSGVERWHVSVGQPFSAAPTWVAGLLVGLVTPGEVVAMHPDSGEVAWRRTIGVPSRYVPVGGVDRVYIALNDGRVAALSAADGTILWQQQLTGTLFQPATDGSRLFIGSDDNVLSVLAADSGALEWRWRMGGDVIGVAVAPDGLVYVASLDNLLRALNRVSGNQRWKAAITTRPAAPPQVAGDLVIMTGVASVVTVYAARTGAVVGTYTVPADLQGVPAMDAVLRPFGVAMVVATREGQVIGLRPVAMTFKEGPLAPFTQLPGARLIREPAAGLSR